MGTIRTTVAALLATLAIVAFQSDAHAQARRSANANVTRTSPQNTRSSGAQASRSASPERKPSATRQSTQVRRSSTPERSSVNQDRRPSTTVTRPTATRPSTSARPSTTRPSTVTRPSSSNRPSTAVRPSASRPSGRNDNQAVKPDGNRPSTRPATRPSDRPSSVRPGERPRPGGQDRPMQQIRPDRRPDRPRVHPRERDFMVYDRPAHFWAHYDHCFGHRVRVLPVHVRRHYYHGVTYYCHNDIWYRPYGGYYVVCRPPFGTVLAANLIADMAWTAVRLSYYNTVANTYSKINENNEYIAEQNVIIAQNNATIAAQNQTIAMNQQLASQAYGLANELGLVQSYAAAGSDYFYQDGIFYMKDSSGEYKVILPPAGALVETLPEDYDMVTLNGDEYYKVDDTVYRVTISDGKPYFEVLGQLPY